MGGVVTNFVYDGLNPVQEKSGSTVTANLLTGLGIDEFFTRTDGGGSRALLTDALGSTVALGDGTGSLVTQYTYEPFGVTSTTGTTSGNSFKYTGREDDGSGLLYYRARYYHPRLQRFISEDPIGLRGGINFYAYVYSNPLKYTDPLGLEVALCCAPVDVDWIPDLVASGLPKHCWLKTDTYESGMAGECPVPGQRCSDKPGASTKTTDHSGQSGTSGL